MACCSTPRPLTSPFKASLDERCIHGVLLASALSNKSIYSFSSKSNLGRRALQVLFDTLKFHGAAFTTPFWMRIFDSVLLPIFDHVRAEVTDTTTFTDEKKRVRK